jgi:transposase InsO family protein
MRIAKLCSSKTRGSMALARRHPEPGLLHHSDRGSQYTCQDYQELLARAVLW